MVNNWEEPSSVYAPLLKCMRIMGFFPSSSGRIHARGRCRRLQELSIGSVIFAVRMLHTVYMISKTVFCLLYAKENWYMYVFDCLATLSCDVFYVFAIQHYNELKSLNQMLGDFPQNTLLRNLVKWIPFLTVLAYPFMDLIYFCICAFTPGQMQRYYNYFIFPFDVSQHVYLFSAYAGVDMFFKNLGYFTSSCVVYFLVTQACHLLLNVYEFRKELKNQMGSDVSAPYLKYATYRLSKLMISMRYFNSLYGPIFTFLYFMGVCIAGVIVIMSETFIESPLGTTVALIFFFLLIGMLLICTLLVLFLDNKSLYSPLIAYQLAVDHRIEDTEFAIQAEILAQLLPNLKNVVTMGGFFPLNRSGMFRVWSAFFAILTYVVQNQPRLTRYVQEMGPADQRDF